MATQDELYHHHSDNYRAVAAGFEQALELLQRAVAAGDDQAADAQTRVAAFLLSVKIEARFYKLLFEPPVPDEFRARINRGEDDPPLIEKWKRTVREAFSLYYSATADFMDSNAPAEAKEQCELHLEALSHLDSVIQLRNKIAHGQWQHALNRKGTEINAEKTRQLKEENLLSLCLKDRVAQIIADAINDLVVSKRAHDRDLERHQRSLRNVLQELETRSYETFARNIRSRERRAQNYRREAVGKPPLAS